MCDDDEENEVEEHEEEDCEDKRALEEMLRGRIKDWQSQRHTLVRNYAGGVEKLCKLAIKWGRMYAANDDALRDPKELSFSELSEQVLREVDFFSVMNADLSGFIAEHFLSEEG